MKSTLVEHSMFRRSHSLNDSIHYMTYILPKQSRCHNFGGELNEYQPSLGNEREGKEENVVNGYKLSDTTLGTLPNFLWSYNNFGRSTLFSPFINE